MDESLAPLTRRAKLHMNLQKLDRLDRRWSRASALPKSAKEQLPVQYWLTRAVTHLGDSWFWWLVAYLLWRRNEPGRGWLGLAQPADAETRLTAGRADVLNWLGTMLVTTALVMFIKQTVQRSRPGDDKLLYGGGADKYSFPSGHAARMGVVAVWAPIYGLGQGAFLSGLAFVVGWTRVRLGIHYWGDVAAGLLIGGLLAVAGRYWHNTFSPDK